MHFPELTAMGSHYVAEEGTEGVRRMVLDGVATHLRGLRVNLASAKDRMTPQVATGSVAARVAFFAGGGGTAVREAAALEVKFLERQIDAAEQKLRRQGAVIRPDGTIDWGLTSRVVMYDHTAVAQGLTRLHPHTDGFLYANVIHTTRFDTSGMVTAFGGRGWCIYVMSQEGNIHASPHSVGNRHHSSLLAGANVAGAGEMRVLQGKLVEISNKSGHYAPAAAHMLQVLYVLQKRGVSLHQTKVRFKTVAAEKVFSSVAAFMTQMKADGIETDFEYAKMMAYLDPAVLPYSDFVPLAAVQGWRWGTPADFGPGGSAHGGRGVVRIVDGTQVPYRDVRKWLKSIGRGMGNRVQSGVGR